MKKLAILFSALLVMGFTSSQVYAQCSGSKTSKSYDGAYAEDAVSDIVDVAAGTDAFSTLVTAVKTANLVDALKGEGPFTVFAPTNDAFGKIPAATLNDLLKPENQKTLTSILTYHVIPGALDAAAVLQAIEDGGGKAVVKTLNGEMLTAMLQGENVVLKDAKGGISIITTTDVKASNGIIHIIDTVVMP